MSFYKLESWVTKQLKSQTNSKNWDQSPSLSNPGHVRDKPPHFAGWNVNNWEQNLNDSFPYDPRRISMTLSGPSHSSILRQAPAFPVAISLISKAIYYLFPLSHVEVTSQVQEVSATRCNLETYHPPQLDLEAGTFPEKKTLVSKNASTPVNKSTHWKKKDTLPHNWTFKLSSKSLVHLRNP